MWQGGAGGGPHEPDPPPDESSPARSARDTDEPQQPPPKPKPATARERNARFGEFYDAYPRKVGRKAAEKAWRAAVRDTDPQVIIDAARRYAERRRGEDPQYTPHPATWLRGARWDDEPDQPPARAAPTRDGTSVFDRARERLALTTGGDP